MEEEPLREVGKELARVQTLVGSLGKRVTGSKSLRAYGLASRTDKRTALFFGMGVSLQLEIHIREIGATLSGLSDETVCWVLIPSDVCWVPT